MMKNTVFSKLLTARAASLSGTLAAFALLLASCGDDPAKTETCRGTLSFSLGKIISVEESPVKSPDDLPAPSDFHIVITSSWGAVVYDGGYPVQNLEVRTGSYTAVVSCGDNPLFGFDTPYFYGSASCTVQPDRINRLSVDAMLANTQVVVTCAPALTAHMTSSALTARVGDESLPISDGQLFYVRAGSHLRIELSGTNGLGAPVGITRSVAVSLAPKTCYQVTLSPVSFTIPGQNPGDVWSKRAYITPATEADISDDERARDIASQIVYEISGDGTNWSPAATADGRPAFTGLAPSTTYTLRGRYGTILSDNTRQFTTETEMQIPNNDFATCHETTAGGQPCYRFYAPDAGEADRWWATRNEMTTSSGINARYTRYSGSRPRNPGIELVTCGWGAGNTAAGGWSFIYNISAGSVFLGSFSGNTEIHGKVFPSRPTAMTFDYTYAPYNNKNDRCIATVRLENRSGGTVVVLAEGSFATGASVGSYTSQTVGLHYTNDRLPATHLCIAFYSGVNEGTAGGNNNQDEYVKDPGFASNDPSRGSVMNINDVRLVYGR